MSIRMEFICTRKWDSMRSIESGKFCESCQKEVKDFTNYSINDIRKLKKTSERICGRFYAEQVDPNIIRELDPLFRKRFFTYLTSALLLSNAKTTLCQTPQPKIEQLATNNLKFNNILTNLPVDDNYDQPVNNNKKTKKIKNPNRRKLYFTRRFPFIKYKKPETYHVMGAVRFL